MKTVDVASVYGSTSGDGKTINLQINGETDPIDLRIPANQVERLARQLLLLAKDAGAAQGLPTTFTPTLATTAIDVPATALAFTVASPTHTALVARCGLFNVAMQVPHISIVTLAKQIQDLQQGK